MACISLIHDFVALSYTRCVLCYSGILIGEVLYFLLIVLSNLDGETRKRGHSLYLSSM